MHILLRLEADENEVEGMIKSGKGETGLAQQNENCGTSTDLHGGQDKESSNVSKSSGYICNPQTCFRETCKRCWFDIYVQR
jgi:hypothetical protein